MEPQSPHPGQGTRLPADMGIEGDWIYEGRWFLFDGRDGSLIPDRPLEIIEAVTPAGQRCIGLDGYHLAELLEAGDLFTMNQRGELVVSLVAEADTRSTGSLFLRTSTKIFEIELNWIDPGWNE